MAKTVNVALIGQGFMGRTHSNAYLKVSKFFPDLPARPVMHTVFGMPAEDPAAYAARWGWQAAFGVVGVPGLLLALAYLGASRGHPDRKVLTSKYANFLKTFPYTMDQGAEALRIVVAAYH